MLWSIAWSTRLLARCPMIKIESSVLAPPRDGCWPGGCGPVHAFYWRGCAGSRLGQLAQIFQLCFFSAGRPDGTSSMETSGARLSCGSTSSTPHQICKYNDLPSRTSIHAIGMSSHELEGPKDMAPGHMAAQTMYISCRRPMPCARKHIACSYILRQSLQWSATNPLRTARRTARRRRKSR